MPPARVVPGHILVLMELCSVPLQQLDRAAATDATYALRIISSLMTPGINVESSVQLVAFASLFIPGAISLGRMGVGK